MRIAHVLGGILFGACLRAAIFTLAMPSSQALADLRKY